MNAQNCVKCSALIFPTDLSVFGDDLDLCSFHHTWKRWREDKQAKDAAQSLEQRNQKFVELCPEQYRLNDVEMIAPEKYQEVMKWRMSPHGLLCMGASQKGKTTACWRLLETLYVLHGISFEAITEAEFSGKLSRQFRDSEASRWLDRLCQARLLFLDDIGHGVTTPKHLEDLYRVVESRTAWRRPMLVTTQFTPSELVESSSTHGKKTIIAILNRLKRSCQIINF